MKELVKSTMLGTMKDRESNLSVYSESNANYTITYKLFIPLIN